MNMKEWFAYIEENYHLNDSTYVLEAIEMVMLKDEIWDSEKVIITRTILREHYRLLNEE